MVVRARRSTKATVDGATAPLPTVKEELQQTVAELRSAVQEQEAGELKPERVREEKRRQEALTAAEAALVVDVDAQLGTLRAGLVAALSELGDKIKAEITRYRQVRDAVAARHAELESIYGLEAGASTLAALLEAQRQKEADFEEEMTRRGTEQEAALEARKTALEADLASTRAAWEKEKLQYTQTLKETKEAERKAQERQKEEFSYAFNRECQQKRDELADELATLEKEIAAKRSTFEREVAAKDAELADREAKVSEREQRADALQARVDGFAAELDAKVREAVKEVSDRLRLQAENSEKLLRAEVAGERKVFEARIEALDRLVASQESQIAALSQKLEQAYGKVQDIAVKAVDSAAKQPKTIAVQTQAPGRGDDGK